LKSTGLVELVYTFRQVQAVPFARLHPTAATAAATGGYGGGFQSGDQAIWVSAGVGESGMGAYHGKAGFAAFSHHKSILAKKPLWICRCAISRIPLSSKN